MGEGLFEEKQVRRLAWTMWAILAFTYLIVFFHRLSLAVILDYLIIDLNIHDAAMAGALVASYALLYMIMQIPSGLLADSWGPRKTVTAGMLVACTGSVIFALAPNLFFAFVGRCLVGLGVSVVLVSILKFQISWFKPSQFATITGLTFLAGNLGVALGTTPFALLVNSVGWRTSFVIIGGVTFFATLLCWLVVRDNPGEVIAGKNKKPLSGPEEEQKEEAPKASFGELIKALKAVIKNPRTWPLFANAFGIYGTLFAFTGTWSVSYLMQIYGLTRNASASLIMAVPLGMIVGHPFMGFVSDKLRRRKLPMLILLSIYIAIWALLFFWNNGQPPLHALYPIFFLIGFGSGSSSTILPLAKEVNEPTFSGIALSVVNIGPFAGMAVLQPLLGYILDLRWEGVLNAGAKIYPLAAYRSLLGACLITLIIAFAFTLTIKETNCRNIYHDEECC
ncbi:MAG: MFS transporter [Bacillota bacterium]|nr:MFS transporter [Bacillota bacterium]